MAECMVARLRSGEMSDAFITLAGPAPARGDLDRWRQIALLGVSAATGEDERARVGLAATLLALDCPAEAGRLLATAQSTDVWARWWTLLAIGQTGNLDALTAALGVARAEVAPRGPNGREVARRLADLDAELAALSGADSETPRFAILGHRARPERRALIGGRSSAVYLVDPAWESLRLIRLGPSDAPAAGNAAHVEYAQVIEAVRRGDGGAGRPVPDDSPHSLQPQPMLDALREDPASRDARLLTLATEVQDERKELARERARLVEARADLDAERQRFRARTKAAAANGSTAPTTAPVSTPTTPTEAAALLGVAVGASRTTVQRHWRDRVASCHPDRVEGLHPALRKQAEDLAVALNAARELLINGAPPRRRG